MKERICTFILAFTTAAVSFAFFFAMMYFIPDSLCRNPLGILWLIGSAALTYAGESAWIYILRHAERP